MTINSYLHKGLLIPFPLSRLRKKYVTLLSKERLKLNQFYFKNHLQDTIKKSGKVDIASLFWSAFGAGLTDKNFPRDEVYSTIFSFVDENLLVDALCGKAFSPYSPNYISSFSALSRTSPDVFSAYYGLGLYELLDEPIQERLAINIAKFLESCWQGNNLAYNEDSSCTDPHNRFLSELAAQAWMYYDCSRILNPLIGRDLRGLDRSNDFKIGRFSFPHNFFETTGIRNPLSAFYYATLRFGPTTLERWGKEVQDFVWKFYNQDDLGFQDFLLEDKRDEVAGSRTRIKHDIPTTSVYATAFSLSLLRWSGYDFANNPRFCDELKKFLIHTHQKSGGHGTKILIRDFKTPYGPVVTPKETTMAILIPALLLG